MFLRPELVSVIAVKLTCGDCLFYVFFMGTTPAFVTLWLVCLLIGQRFLNGNDGLSALG